MTKWRQPSVLFLFNHIWFVNFFIASQLVSHSSTPETGGMNRGWWKVICIHWASGVNAFLFFFFLVGGGGHFTFDSYMKHEWQCFDSEQPK